MSIVAASLRSAAAICAIRKIDVVAMVGEEVSAV